MIRKILRDENLSECNVIYIPYYFTFKYFGLDGNQLYKDIDITADDLKSLICDFDILHMDKKERIKVGYVPSDVRERDPEKLYEFIIKGIQIIALQKLYLKAKNHYIKNCDNTLYAKVFELSNITSELQSQNTRLKNCINITEKEHNDKVKSLHDKIRQLEIQNRRLQQELDTVPKQHEELTKLRDYVYNSKNFSESDFEEEFPIDEICSLIKDHKITIIGGHDNFHAKLKKLFPNWNYISINLSSFDLKLLDVEHTFFFTSYLKHSMYYKAIDYIKNNNKNFGYISMVNINRIISEIYNYVKI